MKPVFVEIETATRCNRRCQWCPTGSKPRGDEQHLMPWPLLVRIVEQLGAVGYDGWIALHNFNEPLLNPRLEDELALIGDVLPRARRSVFTNGDLLTRAHLATFSTLGVAHVRVTRYPAQPLVEDRAAAGRLLARWARARGLADLVVGPPERTRRGWEVTGQVDGVELQVVRPAVAETYSNRAGSVQIRSRRVPRTAACALTTRSAAIDVAGRLKMCCNVSLDLAAHARYEVADLGQTPFRSAWEDPWLRSLRNRHALADWTDSPICATCDQTSYVEAEVSER